MPDDATINTWDLLSGFGFQPATDVISDVKPGLASDFGNFRLSASCVVNMKCQEVVLFGGVLASRRSLAEISFEMPRKVISREQGAAWIVWHLDEASDGRLFRPARETGWINEGRRHRNLLPWVVDTVAYQASPRCTIEREWLRLALKTLAKYLATADDNTTVEIGFDGAVLTFRCAGNVVAMPGEGPPWLGCYAIPVGKIRHLPKRLMDKCCNVSVWDSRLDIGGYTYLGAEKTTEKPNSDGHS